MLTRPQIRAVAAYVGSLSGAGDAAAPDAVAQGEALFTENCTGCHGDKGQGSRDIGAPDLTDAAWIYGGDPETLFATILHGRQGWMPAWEGRLSLADRKILTLYIQNLGKEDAE
jgi:cytochrome c oxidase cbb3-type subunit 3